MFLVALFCIIMSEKAYTGEISHYVRRVRWICITAAVAAETVITHARCQLCRREAEREKVIGVVFTQAHYS